MRYIKCGTQCYDKVSISMIVVYRRPYIYGVIEDDSSDLRHRGFYISF